MLREDLTFVFPKKKTGVVVKMNPVKLLWEKDIEQLALHCFYGKDLGLVYGEFGRALKWARQQGS